jgi:hypothetical protein
MRPTETIVYPFGQLFSRKFLMKTRRTEYLRPLKQNAGMEPTVSDLLRRVRNVERAPVHVKVETILPPQKRPKITRVTPLLTETATFIIGLARDSLSPPVGPVAQISKIEIISSIYGQMDFTADGAIIDQMQDQGASTDPADIIAALADSSDATYAEFDYSGGFDSGGDLQFNMVRNDTGEDSWLPTIGELTVHIRMKKLVADTIVVYSAGIIFNRSDGAQGFWAPAWQGTVLTSSFVTYDFVSDDRCMSLLRGDGSNV